MGYSKHADGEIREENLLETKNKELLWAERASIFKKTSAKQVSKRSKLFQNRAKAK